MAIRISGVNIIDDSFNILNLSKISAGGTYGTSGQVLTSGGPSANVSWAAGGFRYYAQSAAPTATNGDIWVDTDTETAYLRADDVWFTIGSTPVQTGLISGSASSTSDLKSKIERITIPTTGSATNFGSLTLAKGEVQATTDGSRSIMCGGNASNTSVGLDSTDIATGGYAYEIGNLISLRSQCPAACSNGSRGVWAGGTTSTSNIEYAALTSFITAAVFGTLTSARRLGPSATSNGTRGVFAGGFTSAYQSTIDYITIATLGNAISFGSLTGINGVFGSVSSTTRGVYAGGNNTTINMQYITIATVGNAISFGSLTSSRQTPGGVSNGTRGVFSGGTSLSTVIDYITIATTGNATSFGNLGSGASSPGATSGFYGV